MVLAMCIATLLKSLFVAGLLVRINMLHRASLGTARVMLVLWK